MVSLPPYFVATRLPGYFWNIREKKLYSLKVDGVLKPLKLVEPNYWNRANEPFYKVSYKGQRKWLKLSYLNTLKIKDDLIPVKV